MPGAFFVIILQEPVLLSLRPFSRVSTGKAGPSLATMDLSGHLIFPLPCVGAALAVVAWRAFVLVA
ncbi:MAG TPA: hypothetical protein VF598_04740 [Hymenobacter sp.]|jgi:hypothetical protein